MILAALSVLASLTLASESSVVRAPHVEARLVSQVTEFKPGEPFWVALRLDLEKHWHTYWVNPGDSGTPARIKWKLPEGFSPSEIQWPVPQRIPTPPLVSFAYEGDVLLLTAISTPATLGKGTRHTISAEASWLVCKDVCLPGKGSFKLELTASDKMSLNRRWAPAIERTREELPRLARDQGIKIAAQLDEKARLLTLTIRGVAGLTEFFAEEKGLLDLQTAPAINAQGGTVRAQFKVDPNYHGSIDRLRGILTVPGFAPVSVDEPLEGVGGLFRMVLFALLGGLILNLMPCVFPVISIKILGFVHKGKQERRVIRAHGWAYSVGVVLSFLVLAGVLLAIRAAGQKLGWGFQLQAPGFLAFLAALFFLLGMNLLGAFEVGTRLMAIGARAGTEGSLGSSFASGVLATLVATPCTAPFMGAAIGFALSQGAGSALAIFGALGVGMALPYLLLSFFPGWLRWMPKPGRWMETLKQFFAFPLFATVLWLLWSFGTVQGIHAAAELLGALLLLGLGAWMLHRWPGSRLAHGLVLIPFLVAAYLAWDASRTQSSAQPQSTAAVPVGSVEWKNWSPQALKSLLDAGKPVFIDFTASWCISCQVNKRVALTRPEVEAKFRELGVNLLRADWTSGDEVITEALASYDRSGVPVYVLYAPGSRSPILLPEILTPGIVIEELEKAFKKGGSR